MIKKVVLLAAAALTTVVAGGCSDTPAPVAGGTPARSTAPAPSAAASPATKPSGKPVTKPVTEPVTKPVTKPVGDGGNWIAAVRPCPNDGQRIEVRKMARADVTGDGVADVLMAYTCEAVTSYWPGMVAVFDGAAGGERPRLLGNLLEEVAAADEPLFRSVEVSGRTVEITALGREAGKPGSKACPSSKFTYRYEYAKTGFRRVARQAVPNTECTR